MKDYWFLAFVRCSNECAVYVRYVYIHVCVRKSVRRTKRFNPAGYQSPPNHPPPTSADLRTTNVNPAHPNPLYTHFLYTSVFFYSL